VRFGLLAMSSSQDVRFSADKVKQGEDLANKLWNASRLILLRVQDGVEPSADRAETVEDRWILSRLERVATRTDEQIDSFEMSAAALGLYAFFWSELCDWYLELAKPRLYAEDGDRTAVSATLLFALDRTLRLLHPIMPHVTEEIWSFMPGERGLVAAAEWPARDDSGAGVDEQAEEAVGRAIEAITAVRRYRDEASVKPSAVLPARLVADGYEHTEAQVARMARLEWGAGEAEAEIAVPGGVVELLESEDFDPDAAKRRAAAERERVEAEIARLEKKLGNDGFVNKAPAEVVEGERAKLEEYRRALDRLG
jgi:valyl-tRNA synthetase